MSTSRLSIALKLIEKAETHVKVRDHRLPKCDKFFMDGCIIVHKQRQVKK
jgi:hypothetical protein